MAPVRMCFTILLLLAAAAWSESQDQSAATFSVSVNLIKVPLSVFDDHGAPVQDLRREDFLLYEDGVAQQIRSVGLERTPLAAVLVLDTSATVKEEIKSIKEAAEEFADNLSPADRVSVITFDDEVKLRLDWTSNPKLVRKALRKVEPGLRTALYDAMFRAADDQLKSVDGPKAIVLLTDCLNNQSSLGFNEASQAVIQSQASLFVVSKTIMVREAARRQKRVVMLEDIYKRLFGDDGYIEKFFQKRESEMSDLAESTGGRCFFPSDYDQIKDTYARIALELKNKRYLTYISNQRKLPNSYHRITVEYLHPSSKLGYRKGYYFEPTPIHAPRN